MRRTVSVAEFITVRFQLHLGCGHRAQCVVSVAEFITVRFQRAHPTMKPVELFVSVAEFITVRFQHELDFAFRQWYESFSS